MEKNMLLNNYHFCDDIPSEVQALSSSVTGWQITTDSSIGTACGWVYDERFPQLGNTSTDRIDFRDMGKAGTIPTEFGVLTRVTYMDLRCVKFTKVSLSSLFLSSSFRHGG